MTTTSTPRHARTIWLTGLSGAGKSTLAAALHEQLRSRLIHSHVLDGDQLRRGISKDLGYTAADRSEHVRRVAEIARLFNDTGVISIAALISPFQADRDMARQIIGQQAFIEVHLSTPLSVCEARDPKGLYRKARAGQLPGFTGIDAPFEPPRHARLVLDTSDLRPQACVSHLMSALGMTP